MRSVWLLAGLLAGTPALAQSPGGQPDNATLLKALQQLQREISELKAQRAGTVSSAAVPATAPANGAAPPAAVAAPALPKKAVPGWAVKLLPWAEDGPGPAVGWVQGPMADFNFDLHSRSIPSQNRFVYHPMGYFRVPEAGTYTFSVFLEPVSNPISPNDIYNNTTFNCNAEFFVDGNRLFAGGTTFGTPYPVPTKDLFRSQSYFGNAALQQRDYKLEAKVDCSLEGSKSLASFDRALPNWKKNRFKILVKAPADAVPRAFGPQELFFVGQPD